MNDYTPTTEEIRADLSSLIFHSRSDCRKLASRQVDPMFEEHAKRHNTFADVDMLTGFDRWLAAHDAEIAAKALRDEADRADLEAERVTQDMPDLFSGLHRERSQCMNRAQELHTYSRRLRDRADQISKESK